MSKFNRDYFMYIDHKGFLYLQETEPKSYASSIKDQKFMQFFYKNLIKNNTERYLDYQYVSKCWGEFNFVKCYQTPIVYNDLQQIDNQWIILAQNGYKEEFDCQKLFIKDSLFYHKVSLNNLDYGILSTELAIRLGDYMDKNNNLNWEGNLYKL